MQPENQAFLHVQVEPGLFRSERFIRFEAAGQTYQSVVDASDLTDQCLRIAVIAIGDQTALVQLPRDTVAHGSRIEIPKELLVWK